MTLPFYFLDEITQLPSFTPGPEAERGFATLAAKTDAADEVTKRAIRGILRHRQGHQLLGILFTHSPFLSRLVFQFPDFFAQCCLRGPDACFAELRETLAANYPPTLAALMKTLRVAKSKASLLIAIADIAGVWPLEIVTGSMSQLAEICVRQTMRFLLAQAATRNGFTLPDAADPERGSGLFVLAMGKLGANELNYSSDIDLIVFFDRERAESYGVQGAQQLFSRLTQELVRVLQERTADGYAFRVDLRLRPDPASTPAAMSVVGANTYYETVGQNWERAALIKARPIAGDLEAGFQFLRQIAPFIWRRNLDFAAIADIQSIKRQMDARSGAVIELGGHNIKTGIGGIREIEFFAQIHQLIWGGRLPAIRLSGTCRTLAALAENALIPPLLAERLTESYRLFRIVEHRLQMIDDHQTHTIPPEMQAQIRLAEFIGFSGFAEFEQTLLTHLHFVHENFAASFRGQGTLGDEGKLSFTGVENDPQTLETITRMGYRNAASVSEVIQAWHRGARRATRTKRARELITELTPVLLKTLAATRQPDQAFIRFDEFLARLPAGVQLFSLFQANRHLLEIIALIMGSAPAMAESLAKHPNLLDTVLTASFFQSFPDRTQLFNELVSLLVLARDFEDEMDIIRRFKHERLFQAGVQLIQHKVTPFEVSHYLSDVAEMCVQALLHRVEVAYRAKQPELVHGSLAILALGRLGAGELTFGSDIDLVFVYADLSGESGETHHNVLYNKLSQRFISALTALTAEGRLYEVDTRLRPSGKDGALAVSLSAFDRYFTESAWTFEFMALTRGRVVTGRPALREALQAIIRRHLTRPREAGALAQEIIALRRKITQEFGSDDPWNVKYAHGGLMDVDFLAQYFVLLYAPTHPQVIHGSSGAVFRALSDAGLLDPAIAEQLVQAHWFLNSLLALLRLCGGGALDERAAPAGLRHLIAASLDLHHFDSVKAILLSTLGIVRFHSEIILGPSHIA